MIRQPMTPQMVAEMALKNPDLLSAILASKGHAPPQMQLAAAGNVHPMQPAPAPPNTGYTGSQYPQVTPPPTPPQKPTPPAGSAPAQAAPAPTAQRSAPAPAPAPTPAVAPGNMPAPMNPNVMAGP